jgi:predicted transcriptional regulator
MAKVSDIMHSRFLYFDPSDKVSAAAHAMHTRHVAQAPLIERGKFAGIVWASRLAGICLKFKLVGRSEFGNGKKIGEMQVKRIADAFPATLKASDDLASAVWVFYRTGFSQIYVLDKRRKVVGMVDAKDILEHVAAHMTAKKPQAVKIAQEEIESMPRQTTTIDEVLKFVRKNGFASVDEICKKMNLSQAEVEDYADVLGRSGYVKIEYGLLGVARLRSVDK